MYVIRVVQINAISMKVCRREMISIASLLIVRSLNNKRIRCLSEGKQAILVAYYAPMCTHG